MRVKRLLLMLSMLGVIVAVSCSSNRRAGVTRYNTTKQMQKHSTLQKIPRAKPGREQKYKRKGRKDKIMNKSK